MPFLTTPIDGLLVFEPVVFDDERGFFFEGFNKATFAKKLAEKDKDVTEIDFCQENYSNSKKDVLRGLHFQNPNPQGKWVRVTKGEVFDVAVDLRKNSKTCGNWFSITLSSDNKKAFWIPKGFAHGFLTLSDEADFAYKVTDFWDKNSECTLRFDDPDLNIKWPTKNVIMSDKDKNGYFFKDIVLYD
jgi:dTDP-4-dehydrorhamnose 3,5-epimerase